MQKAKKIPDLKWSDWYQDGLCGDFTYLHNWRESTHSSQHKAEVWREKESPSPGWPSGRTAYEAYVMAGPYGETCYLRQVFYRAKEARTAVEQAVLAAIAAGDMSRNDMAA